MRLHLGCGENYLKGYCNIDFSSTHHTVQKKGVADRYANILNLKYKKSSIEEIRLHHVFEHFSRAIACALLVSWHSWLEIGGLLRVEVPDFENTSKIFGRLLSTEHQRNVAMRHIFGSQEASWAVHYTGWTEKTLTALLNKLGYSIEKVNRFTYKGTSNLEVFARKAQNDLSNDASTKVVKSFLKSFTLDGSTSEKEILSVWLSEFKSQVAKGVRK